MNEKTGKLMPKMQQVETSRGESEQAFSFVLNSENTEIRKIHERRKMQESDQK